MKSKIETMKEVKRFILAGNAVFTAKLLNENIHYIFKVVKSGKLFQAFVKDGWTYIPIGSFSDKLTLKVLRNKKIKSFSDEIKLFKHILDNLDGSLLFIDIYHEGLCGRCGRALTLPKSIISGFGPVCLKHMERGE